MPGLIGADFGIRTGIGTAVGRKFCLYRCFEFVPDCPVAARHGKGAGLTIAVIMTDQMIDGKVVFPKQISCQVDPVLDHFIIVAVRIDTQLDTDRVCVGNRRRISLIRNAAVPGCFAVIDDLDDLMIIDKIMG